MHESVRLSYTTIRGVLPARPVVLLHIGEEQSCVVAGTVVEPVQMLMLMLEMGSSLTSTAFFKHNPSSR